MNDKVKIHVDRSRVRKYFILATTLCVILVWALWFMLGFMGSRSSPDGITTADLIRTTLYSLPAAMILSAVFPMVVMGERHSWWLVDDGGIEIYDKKAMLLHVSWAEVDDVIFREYSVGIYLRGRIPDEYNVFLPSEEQCERLSQFYNQSKGIHCKMDER